MKLRILMCLTVFAIFLSSGLCFGNENESHPCFKMIDKNKDGAVTFQEFKEVFGDDKVKYNEIDLNKDGKLSHDEYHQSLGHGAS